MLIGIDFDNTIVNYDLIFHKVAKEKDCIDDSIPESKLAVRDYLRATRREQLWIEMQGYVYGARMMEAQVYPEALKVMRRLQNAGHDLAIVSHKTKFPYLGIHYDLHEAAHHWIDHHLCDESGPLVHAEHIYFELTKDEKLSRINQINCDVFLDDLPEILLASTFPEVTQRYLFDPERHHINLGHPPICAVDSWINFERCIL